MKRIFAILLAMALMLGVGAVAEGTMTVQGTGIVTVDADRATVCLGVREVAADVMTAQSTVNGKLDAVIDALREAGVEDGCISTSGLGIYPNYDYSDVETISGYTAYNSINIVVKNMDGLGAIIDAAFAAGANSLDYVEFSAADTAEAADQALTLAVQSATQKARTLAEAAGVSLGEILEIRDNDINSYDLNGRYALTEEADKGAGTLVIASRQQVFASVTITFALSGD